MRRAKYKIMQLVRLTDLGTAMMKIWKKTVDWPTEGDFTVLGRMDPQEGGEWNYLIENVKEPDHFALWVPESWIRRSGG